MGIISSICEKYYKNNKIINVNKTNDLEKNEYYKEYITEAENLICQFINISQNNKLNKIDKYNKLNNIYYKYDMIICRINTEYNKDSYKMNVELLKDHSSLLEYLYKLKSEHMDNDIINLL
jgi:hypothetical protein